MEIEKIKITDIIPAEYNPRQISDEELTKLTNSINEFGLVDPIIINLKNNKIIGGHQRYDVLINQYILDNNFYAELNLLRFGDIGWIFTDTDLKIESEEHEKALNLALNKIRVNQRKGDYEFSRDDAELGKWLKDSQALPEDLYQKKEELYLIHKKLSELPVHDSLLLEAKYILQLKDEEIAEQFNISQQSVRTYIMRARRKAYALFKEDMENE